MLKTKQSNSVWYSYHIVESNATAKYFILNAMTFVKEAVNLLHLIQLKYIEGINSNKGGNVWTPFYVESDFGVSFIKNKFFFNVNFSR